MKLLLFVLASLTTLGASQDPPVKLNGNLIANGVTEDGVLTVGNAASPKSTSTPFVTAQSGIKTGTVDVKATSTFSETLEATKAITIKSLSQIQGSQELKIEGKLSVHGKFVAPEAESDATFFLEELILNDASQYASVEHLGGSLPSGAYSDGWKWSDGTKPNSELYEISDPYYLEACPSVASSNLLEISREFFAPDASATYEINTNFHFLNGDWNGHVGYLKVNDEIVWMESYSSQSASLDLARDRFSVPIKAVFKANGPTFKVSFGSNLDTNVNTEAALGGAASAAFCSGPAWSVNDVTISLRKSS